MVRYDVVQNVQANKRGKTPNFQLHIITMKQSDTGGRRFNFSCRQIYIKGGEWLVGLQRNLLKRKIKKKGRAGGCVFKVSLKWDLQN